MSIYASQQVKSHWSHIVSTPHSICSINEQVVFVFCFFKGFEYNPHRMAGHNLSLHQAAWMLFVACFEAQRSHASTLSHLEFCASTLRHYDKNLHYKKRKIQCENSNWGRTAVGLSMKGSAVIHLVLRCWLIKVLLGKIKWCSPSFRPISWLLFFSNLLSLSPELQCCCTRHVAQAGTRVLSSYTALHQPDKNILREKEHCLVHQMNKRSHSILD